MWPPLSCLPQGCVPSSLLSPLQSPGRSPAPASQRRPSPSKGAPPPLPAPHHQSLSASHPFQGCFLSAQFSPQSPPGPPRPLPSHHRWGRGTPPYHKALQGPQAPPLCPVTSAPSAAFSISLVSEPLAAAAAPPTHSVSSSRGLCVSPPQGLPVRLPACTPRSPALCTHPHRAHSPHACHTPAAPSLGPSRAPALRRPGGAPKSSARSLGGPQRYLLSS